jgi:hypothetical protein
MLNQILKKTIVALALLTTAAPAMADGLYFTEPMLCAGHIVSAPSYMQPDYYNIAIQITSMFSTRRDGSLAPAIEVQTSFYKDGQRFDFSKPFPGEEVWYMAPLRSNGNQVTSADLGLQLTTVHVENIRGKITQYLAGTMVHPSMGQYNLKCTSVVVARPSRVDNFTRRR